MKTITIIWLLCLLRLLRVAVHSKQLPGKVLCGKNEITDWTVNNSTTVCRECPVCPIAYGSTFPCGGVMRYPHEKPIECERCINGKTFSDSSNTDMCIACSDCSLRYRKVLDTCTIFKDTLCGGCEDGYYEFRNESTGNNTCEKCSRCCDDGKDNKIQECIDQGLQSSGHVCSVFDKERCKPKPTRDHQESPTIMTHHNDTLSTTSTTTHWKENEQGASDGPNVVVTTVVPVVIVIILGVVVALIAWYWCKKKKKNSNGFDIEQDGNERIRLIDINTDVDLFSQKLKNAVKDKIQTHPDFLISPLVEELRLEDVFTQLVMYHERKKSNTSHMSPPVCEEVEDVSEEDVSEEDVSEEDVSGEDVSEEDVSGEDVSEEDVSEEDISEEDVSEEDIFEDVFQGFFEEGILNKKELHPSGKKAEKILSIEDVFKKKQNQHSILITGNAGIGKTLFCRKLIVDWSKDYIFNKSESTDIPVIKCAFLLTFRQLNDLTEQDVSLKELINLSSLSDENTMINDSIMEDIIRHPKQLLILFDGLDEYKDREKINSDSDSTYPNDPRCKMPVAALVRKLVQKKILSNSVVMVTSRPAEAKGIKNFFSDGYVEITGRTCNRICTEIF